MYALLLSLLLSQAHAVKTNTQGTYTAPAITSATVTGQQTGALVIKESGASVDPDVLTDTVGCGNIDDQAGAGNVGLGCYAQQAGAGDGFAWTVDPNGGVYFIVGNRTGAGTMSPFMQYDSNGSLAMGGRGSGGGGAAGATPAFIYNETTGKVGIFENSPNGQVDIAALAARRPTDPLVQISSQNAAAVVTINVNGDVHAQGNLTVISSSTIKGNLQVDGTANIIGLGGTPLVKISTSAQAGACTAVTNLDSCSTDAISAYRIGNVIEINFKLAVDATAAGNAATEGDVALPVDITTNFSDASQANGICASGSVNSSGRVVADATNDKLQVEWASQSAGAIAFHCKVTYILQ